MKKGELSIQVIVITILALLVLVILAIAYKSQLGSLLGNFTDLIQGTTNAADNVDVSGLVK